MWIEKWYEYTNKRICRYWLQKETCRDCLFEVLCDYEDMKAKNDWKKIKERFINNK